MAPAQEMPTDDTRSLAERLAAGFETRLLDEERCRRELAALVRPVIACPACNRLADVDQRDRLYKGRDVVCRCGRKHSLFTGTVLCGLQIGAAGVIVACWMRQSGARLSDIATATGVSIATVSRLLDRLSVTVAR